MNYEKAMIVNFMRKFWLYADKEVDTYIILGGNVKEEDDEWQGVVNAMKKTNTKFFKKTNQLIKSEVDNVNYKIIDVNNRIDDANEKIIG